MPITPKALHVLTWLLARRGPLSATDAGFLFYLVERRSIVQRGYAILGETPQAAMSGPYLPDFQARLDKAAAGDPPQAFGTFVRAAPPGLAARPDAPELDELSPSDEELMRAVLMNLEPQLSLSVTVRCLPEWNAAKGRAAAALPHADILTAAGYPAAEAQAIAKRIQDDLAIDAIFDSIC